MSENNDLQDLCERLRDSLLKLPFHCINGGKSWGVELVEVDRMIRAEFKKAGADVWSDEP